MCERRVVTSVDAIMQRINDNHQRFATKIAKKRVSEQSYYDARYDGFAKPANNIAFNAVTENFLAACLGGRAEAIGDTLGASTAEIVTGAEFVEGLEAQPGG